MKISIDTKEDSHEEIRKAIKLLQNIIGEGALTNSPDLLAAAGGGQNGASAGFEGIFGEAGSVTNPPKESTDDIFAELFNQDDVQKIKESEEKEEQAEEDLIKKKKSSHSIEFY